MAKAAPLKRLKHHAYEWRVAVETTLETESSLIAFGSRNAARPVTADETSSRHRQGAAGKLHDNEGQSVVLKVVKRPGDEWHSGEILQAFNGRGVARVLEQASGAVLVERLRPGNSLVSMTLNGQDEEATEILIEVVRQMSSLELSSVSANLENCPTVNDWAKGFEHYLDTGDRQLPRRLVEAGQRVYVELCASQRGISLLHGDLQPYNVLFDTNRGWVAIDPKGVIGEVDYEIGAILRNPAERPELFLSRPTIERRITQFTNKLDLDFDRTLAWGFAQAVLSAIWCVEDGFKVNESDPILRLAVLLQSMLFGSRNAPSNAR